MPTPPSPRTPSSGPTIGENPTLSETDNRILATTSQLEEIVERSLDVTLGWATVDDVLLELDRRAYVECVGLTADGDYVWDLTESPERLATTVADIVTRLVRSWLDDASTE